MGDTILIIDDSQLDLEILTSLISRNSAIRKIHTADNVIQGISMAVQYRPDLILLDCEMPEMPGVEVLQVLKSNELTKKLPVILMSGESFFDKIKTAFDNGASDFIQKPVFGEELLARTKAALENYSNYKSMELQRNQLKLANNTNERILQSILPLPILNQIKQYGSIPPKRYKNCVAIFVDIVDFTSKTVHMSPGNLLRELNGLFSGFDKVIDQHFCTRIKTVGDAYIAVCGMFHTADDIIIEAASAAVKIREYVFQRNRKSDIEWEIRIGMYGGDIIGSSVSAHNLSFDIFGETVNMASRFQTICDPMQINVSESLRESLSKKYKLIARVPRNVKGKGNMSMYYIHHELSLKTYEEPVYEHDSSLYI